MALTYIPAVAAFSGSAAGALATILTNWVRQRRQHRDLLTSRTNSKREELYKSFIEEASRLYADALIKDKSEISELVDLYALIGRMKILSSDDVIEAAERVGRLILETYLSPKGHLPICPTYLTRYIHCGISVKRAVANCKELGRANQSEGTWLVTVSNPLRKRPKRNSPVRGQRTASPFEAPLLHRPSKSA